MEIFWFITVPSTILVVFFVVRPMFKTGQMKLQENEQLHISIYRENLQEIESEYTSGQLDAGQLENVRNELELSLLRESTGNNVKGISTDSRRPMLIGTLLAVMLFIVTLVMYYRIGNPQLISLQKFGDVNSEETWNNGTSPDRVSGLMEAHLQRNPEDANGLYFLANLYLAESSYENALSAFERLTQLVGDNTQVMLAYADTLVRVNNGSFAGRATELIHRVLAQEPGNYSALLFAGLAAEETGKYGEANQYYTRLLPALKDQPEMMKTIEMLIANNRIMMQESGTEDTATAEAIDNEVDPASSVQLNVSVSADFTDRYDPGDTLFIYAQAVQGSPMPLAVIRARAADLPMRVTLDDSMAMMPTQKISSHAVVRVQARISKSGSAEPGSGDMLGVLENISVADTEVTELIINEVIP